MKSFQTKKYFAVTCLVWIIGGVLAFHTGNSNTVATPNYSYTVSSESPLDPESSDNLTFTNEENNEALYTLQTYQESLDNYMTKFTNYWTTTTKYYKSVAMECLGIIRGKYETAYNSIQELIDSYYPNMQLPGYISYGRQDYNRFYNELEVFYYDETNVINRAENLQEQSNVIENEQASNDLLDFQTSLTEEYENYKEPISAKAEPISSFHLTLLQKTYNHSVGQLQTLYDNYYWTYELSNHQEEIETIFNAGIDRMDSIYQHANYAGQDENHTETVTAFSSPSFTITLNPNGSTAQYVSGSYYRLGGGGSLTLTGKGFFNRIVNVKMNLQDPARCGNDVTVSAGTLVGDSIIDVNDNTLTITARGSWPQLWLTSLTVTYQGTAPVGTYAIRLPQYLANGTVTSDMDWADEGDVVTLTATPQEGYHLSQLYANRGAVTLSPSAVAADQYTFTMPAEDVTIGVAFAEGDITTGLQLNVPEDSEANNAAPIYNLQGQRLTKPQRGVNIVGGKKVVCPK